MKNIIPILTNRTPILRHFVRKRQEYLRQRAMLQNNNFIVVENGVERAMKINEFRNSLKISVLDGGG